MTMWIHDMEIREEGIEIGVERGREEAHKELVRNLMENMGWTAQQAEKALGYAQQGVNT